MALPYLFAISRSFERTGYYWKELNITGRGYEPSLYVKHVYFLGRQLVMRNKQPALSATGTCTKHSGKDGNAIQC